jgi:hypothetical protein
MNYVGILNSVNTPFLKREVFLTYFNTKVKGKDMEEERQKWPC